MTKTVEEFINKAQYDRDGQMIWGVGKDGGQQIIADLRGWGAIQNMFMDSGGAVDLEKAAKFQDEMGEWIADAINQKLRDPNEGFPMGMG
jgi:hypothetical protein